MPHPWFFDIPSIKRRGLCLLLLNLGSTATWSIEDAGSLCQYPGPGIKKQAIASFLFPGTLALRSQIWRHEEIWGACGKSHMERRWGPWSPAWLSSQLTADTNLLAIWVSRLKSGSSSPKLSGPRWCHMEQDKPSPPSSAQVADLWDK